LRNEKISSSGLRVKPYGEEKAIIKVVDLPGQDGGCVLAPAREKEDGRGEGEKFLGFCRVNCRDDGAYRFRLFVWAVSAAGARRAAVTWFLTALAGKKVKVNGQGVNLLTVTVLMVSAEVCFVC
jgi:hypothetical protein